MRRKKFLMITLAYVSAMICLVLLAWFYSDLLQVPPQITKVLTVLSICSGTIGGAVGLIIFYVQRHRNR